jgi:hypothetical protein
MRLPRVDQVLRNKGVSMRLAIVVAFVLLSPVWPAFSQGHMGTPEEQRACRADAQRFCRQQLSDDLAVSQCLQQHKAQLSKPCKKVFESHGM